jgi:uncharacterized protein with ParB-like and HNH nuclease domain
MDARAKSVREILHSGDQFLVPFFQRHYSWRRKHWERLRADLWTLMEDANPSNQHFLGPLVCTPAGHVPGEVPAYQLIDGQQRLTTLTLLLSALRDEAREQGLDDLAEEVMEDYLIHKRKPALQRYKVVPRIGDRDVLIAVVEGKLEKPQHKEAVAHAWQFYKQKISDLAINDPAMSLNKLFLAVTERLSLVVITIDDENPYEIFESLNSTGLPLEESDLIRNFLFMQVPIGEQEAFNATHWAAFEKAFEEVGEYPAIPQTPFYRTYLMRHGVYSKSKFTFVDFKEQNKSRELSPVEQVNELKRFASYELQFRRPRTCENEKVRRALSEIAMLEITTAHPLLVNLADRLESGQIDESTYLACLQDLASFVLRRSICGESTRSYGRWFCEAAAVIKDKPRDDLRNYWLRRGWPDDATFFARLVEFPIYRREPKKCRHVLERLEESYGHKEKVDVSTLSIEHVMPQMIEKGKFAKTWQEVLGDEWRAIHERYLHTLGNLTLSGYNPNLSNRTFAEKKLELAKSNLVLNRCFDNVQVWGVAAIEERGNRLAQEIGQLWPRPAGGEYTPPTDDEPKKLTKVERRQRNLDYWSAFLALAKGNNGLPELPKASRRELLGFPTGTSRFRYLAIASGKKRYVGISLVCRGKKAKENFESLRNERELFESKIGHALLWQEAATASTSRITLRLPNVRPWDTNDWPKQHKWLMDTLAAYRATFSQRCKELGSAEPKPEDRKLRRHRFWQTLLNRASAQTQLHSGVSASHDGWISTGAGWSGFSFNYVIGKSAGRVELYIDRGKNKDAENRKLFDALKRKRTAIEDTFGDALSWERLDDRRGCRIAFRIETGGYRSDEADWPAIQDAMIDAMVRLEKALASPIASLRSASI